MVGGGGRWNGRRHGAWAAKAGGGGFAGGLGGMLGQSPGQRQPGTVLRTEYVEIDKVNDQKLAEDIKPCRLVVINGSFPYRKELEEFRSKLRKRSLTELMSLIDSGDATFAFKGFEVERQVYGSDGKVKLPWHNRTKEMIEALNAIKALAVDFAAEDEKLKDYGMLNPGLVAPLPMLARDAKYPPTDVNGLNEAIASLNKQIKPDSKRPTSDLAKKLRGKGAFNAFDPFSPFNFEDEKEDNPPAKPAMPPKEGEKGASDDVDADLVIPDKVLVRLVDVVEPGNTYEYRIKVKMANPNFKQTKNVAYAALAKPSELVASDWSMVPKIEVPRESFWYAVDGRADPEKVNLQLHRWVDYTMPASDLSASNGLAVADWNLRERDATHRGEYIGRVVNVDVPVWSIENENYEFAHIKGKAAKIPIDFTVREQDSRHPPALLVDFSGGKGSSARGWGKTLKEDVPLELLVLNPDGKLVMRNSVDDEENTERSARDTEVREWRMKVRLGAAGRKGGGVPPGPGGLGGARGGGS